MSGVASCSRMVNGAQDVVHAWCLSVGPVPGTPSPGTGPDPLSSPPDRGASSGFGAGPGEAGDPVARAGQARGPTSPRSAWPPSPYARDAVPGIGYAGGAAPFDAVAFSLAGLWAD